MECGLFECPKAWRSWLPPGARGLDRKEELAQGVWGLMALTPSGLLRLDKGILRCHVLLLPGGSPLELASLADTDCLITYGLSNRDSLTLSSLEEPVLCVQRTLPRPDGSVVEPQELPLNGLPAPAEELLPLLGLYLLRMPLTDGKNTW